MQNRKSQMICLIFVLRKTLPSDIMIFFKYSFPAYSLNRQIISKVKHKKNDKNVWAQKPRAICTTIKMPFVCLAKKLIPRELGRPRYYHPPTLEIMRVPCSRLIFTLRISPNNMSQTQIHTPYTHIHTQRIIIK